jgi:hypothetical protein
MENGLWPGVLDEVAHGGAIPDVRLNEASAGAEGRVEVLAPAGGEVVDRRQLVAAGNEGVDEVRADEPRPACHEGAHMAAMLFGDLPRPPAPLVPSPG